MSKSDRGVVDVMVCGLRSSPVTAVSFLFIKKVKCAGANLIQLLPIESLFPKLMIPSRFAAH